MSELYQRLTGFQNLCNSFTKARRGKRGKASVARFEHNLENEIFLLQDELLTFSYQPGAYRSFYRTEAKRRLISAAPFRDRVVHHALVGVTQDLFERRFIYDSYANRVGKGTHKALDRCTQFMRTNQYVLPCDIRQFFPSIDHGGLLIATGTRPTTVTITTVFVAPDDFQLMAGCQVFTNTGAPVRVSNALSRLANMPGK